MNENEININDLVWMYRGCSDKCTCRATGRFFQVSEIIEIELYCTDSTGQRQMLGKRRGARGIHLTTSAGDAVTIPLEWLKKVPPLTEPEMKEEEMKVG